MPISGTSAVDGHRNRPAPWEMPRKSRYPPKIPTDALVTVIESRRATDGTPLVPVDRISISTSSSPQVISTCAPACLNMLTGSKGIRCRSAPSRIPLGIRPAASHWAR
ncbi:Uncharacterised protein [Mycobacteroides abscessus subsp. abscessus]|nr:Uncharacterised protein [Mycobacteroides abscessus subsp. abscessus]